MLDGILCHPVMMMTTNTTMFDALALRIELSCKLLGCVDPIVGTVRANRNPDGSCLAFETKFGLDRLGSGKSDLMNDGELGTGGVAEDGAATVLLSSKVITSGRELPTKERGLILIGEDKIPWLQFVHLESAAGVLDESRPFLWSPLLLPELAGRTFWWEDGSRAHFDAKMAKEPATAEPLSVLPSKMAPLGVPSEETLLERGEIRGGSVGNPFESEGLGSSQDVVECTDNRERRLTVIPDGNKVTVKHLKVRLVPFQDISSTFVRGEHNLRAEESDLKVGEVVSVTFQERDTSGIV
jgi:hypothetical protein